MFKLMFRHWRRYFVDRKGIRNWMNFKMFNTILFKIFIKDFEYLVVGERKVGCSFLKFISKFFIDISIRNSIWMFNSCVDDCIERVPDNAFLTPIMFSGIKASFEVVSLKNYAISRTVLQFIRIC